MFDPFRAKSEPIDKLTIAYMEERYGENFTGAGPTGNSMTGNYSMYVTCESMPSINITAKVLNFKREDRIFQDNYLVFKHQEEIKNYLQRFALEEFSEANVYISVSAIPLSASIPADATAEAVMRDENFMLSATVEVRESEFKEAAQAEKVMLNMGKALYGKELISYHVMFIAVEEEKFGELTNSELSQAYVEDTYVRTAKIQKWSTGSNTVWKEAEA